MSPKSASGEVLSNRALNRALLARQSLLEREAVSVEALLEKLVGIQAQEPQSPYVGLWSRIQNFEPDQLSTLLTERRAVRMALMRSTIHLVTADDAFRLRPVVQPVIDREIVDNKAWSPNLEGLDLDALREAGRALLDVEPMSPAALGKALQQRWPERHPASLAHAVRTLLPLVQVPPRGVWGKSGQTKLATAQAWLGRDDIGSSLAEVALRYFGAFGPATVADLQTWSGLRGLRETVDALRPQLVSFRDERGRELFDLPDSPRPGESTPAPVRFLPEYDNLLLSHSDRSRMIPAERRDEIVRNFGTRFFIADGFVAGRWKPDVSKDAARLTIDLFESAQEHRTAMVAEAEHLLTFLAPGLPGSIEFGRVVSTRQR